MCDQNHGTHIIPGEKKSILWYHITRVLLIDLRVLESNDKGFKDFKPTGVPLKVPCSCVLNNFLPGNVAAVFA